jgi:hypothetical protein
MSLEKLQFLRLLTSALFILSPRSLSLSLAENDPVVRQGSPDGVRHFQNGLQLNWNCSTKECNALSKWE